MVPVQGCESGKYCAARWSEASSEGLATDTLGLAVVLSILVMRNLH